MATDSGHTAWMMSSMGLVQRKWRLAHETALTSLRRHHGMPSPSAACST